MNVQPVSTVPGSGVIWIFTACCGSCRTFLMVYVVPAQTNVVTGRAPNVEPDIDS